MSWQQNKHYYTSLIGSLSVLRNTLNLRPSFSTALESTATAATMPLTVSSTFSTLPVNPPPAARSLPDCLRRMRLPMATAPTKSTYCRTSRGGGPALEPAGRKTRRAAQTTEQMAGGARQSSSAAERSASGPKTPRRPPSPVSPAKCPRD